MGEKLVRDGLCDGLELRELAVELNAVEIGGGPRR